MRARAAQRLSGGEQILAKLGGRCAAEYKYDGVRIQAHKTADGQIELFTRRLERVSTQFPDVVEALAVGLDPAEAIVEGEVVAVDPSTWELRPFGEVMFRRRKYGIAAAVRDVPAEHGQHPAPSLRWTATGPLTGFVTDLRRSRLHLYLATSAECGDGSDA